MCRCYLPSLLLRPWQTLTVLLGAVVLATGCTTLSPSNDKLSALAAGEKAELAEKGPPRAVILEVRGLNGKSKVQQVPLTGEEHVGDVLIKSGALKRFSSFEVAVIRQQPGGPLAKMNVALAPGKRKVVAESDYFLHPGDRVLVKEVEATSFVEEFMGPLARKK